MVLITKEEIKKKKKQVIRKVLKYAKEHNDDFITFLIDLLNDLKDNRKDIPKGLRKMIRELQKKAILLTKTTVEQKKWSLEFFRDYELYDSDDELLVINQMLVDNKRIDPEYDGEKQDWEYLEIEQESRVDVVNVADKKIDKTRVIIPKKNRGRTD